MFLDPNGLEILPTNRCRELIEQHEIGRLGFVQDEQVTVLPVTYAVVRGQILIRTNAGSKLDAATAGRQVALEIDEVDPRRHTGWSVVVHGTMSRVSDPEEVAQLNAADLPMWGPVGNHYLRIPLDDVTGRVLHAGPRQTDRPTPPPQQPEVEPTD